MPRIEPRTFCMQASPLPLSYMPPTDLERLYFPRSQNMALSFPLSLGSFIWCVCTDVCIYVDICKFSCLPKLSCNTQM